MTKPRKDKPYQTYRIKSGDEEVFYQVEYGNIPEELYLQLKAICHKERTSMRQRIIDWIRDYIALYNSPDRPASKPAVKIKIPAHVKTIRMYLKHMPKKEWLEFKAICAIEKTFMKHKIQEWIRDTIKEKGAAYVLTPEEVEAVQKRRRQYRGDEKPLEKTPKWEPVPDDLPLGEYLDPDEDFMDSGEEEVRRQEEEQEWP